MYIKQVTILFTSSQSQYDSAAETKTRFTQRKLNLRIPPWRAGSAPTCFGKVKVEWNHGQWVNKTSKESKKQNNSGHFTLVIWNLPWWFEIPLVLSASVNQLEYWKALDYTQLTVLLGEISWSCLLSQRFVSQSCSLEHLRSDRDYRDSVLITLEENIGYFYKIVISLQTKPTFIEYYCCITHGTTNPSKQLFLVNLKLSFCRHQSYVTYLAKL